MNKIEHDHICYCGTSVIEGGHKVGTHDCVRYITDPPTAIMNEKDFTVKWDTGDGNIITDFTLRQQRGYHQFTCGCWSRWSGSKNSLLEMLIS